MKQSDIFFFDVDGTLLNNETHTISEKTIEALHLLKAQGYAIALCTGRTLDEIKMLKIDTLVAWDGYVLANGCTVYDRFQDLVFEQPIEHHIIEALIKDGGGPVLLQGSEDFITSEPNDNLIATYAHFQTEPFPIKTFTNQTVYNAFLFSKAQATDQLLELLATETNTVHDVLGNLEIIPRAAGKDRGVEQLMELLQLEKAAFFGDGENDIAFMKKAYHGVAMGNAQETLKAIAHDICASVAQDGIFHYLMNKGVISYE